MCIRGFTPTKEHQKKLYSRPSSIKDKIKYISINKFRLTRAYSYIAMFAMPLLVVDMIERRYPEIPFIPLFVISMIGVWLIGFIDDKAGFLNNESSYAVTRNKILYSGLYKK